MVPESMDIGNVESAALGSAKYSLSVVTRTLLGQRPKNSYCGGQQYGDGAEGGLGPQCGNNTEGDLLQPLKEPESGDRGECGESDSEKNDRTHHVSEKDSELTDET